MWEIAENQYVVQGICQETIPQRNIVQVRGEIIYLDNSEKDGKGNLNKIADSQSILSDFLNY